VACSFLHMFFIFIVIYCHMLNGQLRNLSTNLSKVNQRASTFNTLIWMMTHLNQPISSTCILPNKNHLSNNPHSNETLVCYIIQTFNLQTHRLACYQLSHTTSLIRDILPAFFMHKQPRLFIHIRARCELKHLFILIWWNALSRLCIVYDSSGL
jgi:hypothetical protein